MRALSPSELLRVWEQGVSRSAVDRALILLRTACDDTAHFDPAQCTIGERDTHLLALRERMFGPDMTAVVACQQCGATLELSFRSSDLRVPHAEAPPPALEVTEGEYRVRFRLPNSLDLQALQSSTKADCDAQSYLLQRCLLEAACRGEKLEHNDLPEAVRTAIVQRMAEADPQAESELALQCFECGHRWQEPFDIESYLWAEIQANSARLLNEVHHLAGAYGWSESEVLALSPVRRSLYLQLVTD